MRTPSQPMMPLRAAAVSIGALALTLVGSACGESEPDEPAADQNTTPPLEEPAEPEEETGSEAESESDSENSAEGTGEAAGTEPDAEGDEGGSGEDSDASEIIDVSEFSRDQQESSGFPDPLTPVPEDVEELLLTDVRVGGHEEYDRVVFEHSGEGAPGWFAEYVDEAVQPGSGFPLDFDGDAILYISAVGLMPGNAGEEQGHLELTEFLDEQGTLVDDITSTAVHHGAASYYIALDEERDVRVSVWEHEDGPRLIIDVLH